MPAPDGGGKDSERIHSTDVRKDIEDDPLVPPRTASKSDKRGSILMKGKEDIKSRKSYQNFDNVVSNLK